MKSQRGWQFHPVILAAMEEERKPFEALIGDVLPEAPWSDAFLIRSGVGKVHAALAANDAIRNEVDRLFSVGFCGAISPGLEPGDLFIVADAIQHDVDVTALGFRRGQIPFFENHLSPRKPEVFKADPRLVRMAATAADELGIPWNRRHIGRMLTGDCFVADQTKAEILGKGLEGHALDMETAAIGQALNGSLPWLGLRIVSDRADGSAPTDFSKATIATSLKSIVDIIRAIGNLPFEQMDR